MPRATEPAPSGATRAPHHPLAIVLLATAVLCAVRALVNPIEHDIDQYLGGAMVGSGRTIYRDFLHLQTPLQVWIWAPLLDRDGPYGFLLMHLAPIACGIGIAALVQTTARRTGATPRAAMLATLLMVAAEPFLYSATTLRNDALPGLLAAAAMGAGVAAVQRGDRLAAALTGLGWGLAASVKISYLVVAGAGGSALILLAVRGRIGWSLVVTAGLGGLAGLAPTLVAMARAPEAFLWGVFTYASTAPFAWNEINGLAHRLTIANKLLMGLTFLALGPALPALLLVGLERWRRRAPPPPPELVLVDVLLIGGLVAALLPTPIQRGYFLPAMLPLFVRVAPMLGSWRGIWGRVKLAAFGLATLATAIKLAVLVGLAAERGAAVVAVDREGRWIGQQVRAAGLQGAVATLSPRLLVSSGLPLDPRFATGVFVFRTGALLSARQAFAFHVCTPATMAAMFRQAPPAAIVVGYEGPRPSFPADPDKVLADYARRAGWTRRDSPFGRAVLFLNPAARPAILTAAHRLVIGRAFANGPASR